MRTSRWLAVLAFLSSIVAVSAGAQAGRTQWTTQFRGPGMCLDVVNGGSQDRLTHLAPCGPATGQHWFAQPIAGGWTTFTTEFRGPTMCLDVVNGGALDGFTHLTPCAGLSGQVWSSSPR